MFVLSTRFANRVVHWTGCLMSVLLLTGCSKDEDQVDQGLLTPVGTMTFEIDGADRTSTQFLATARFGDVNGVPNSLGITAGFAGVSGNYWILTMIINDTENVPQEAGKTWDESSLDRGVVFSANYEENFDPETDVFNGVYAQGEPFSVTITAIDTINRIISGEFSLVIKPENEDSTYEITNGKFNRIPYDTREPGEGKSNFSKDFPLELKTR